MDDEVGGQWSIDPETRAQMRLEQVRRLLDEGDFAGALIEVEELLDEEPDNAEGLFLLGEALLELDDVESAADTYERFLAMAGEEGAEVTPAGRAGALCGLAVAKFELGDAAVAAESAREAARLLPDLGQAHFYLGLALERLDRKSEAIKSFVTAHRLDAEAYPLPVDVRRDQWPGLLKKALSRAPVGVQKFWNGVEVRFEELPTADDLKRSEPPLSPLVVSLYEGMPPEDEDEVATARPEALRLFTANLVRAGTLDGVVGDIGRALSLEAADWLGIDEDELV